MLKHTLYRWVALSCLAIFTTACGGGGGSGGSNSGSSSSATPPSSGAPSSGPSSSPSTSPLPPPPASVNRVVGLTWSIPTTRADGAPLAASAISAYRLFYTRDGSATSEDAIVVINNGAATNTNITLAATGTYTFAITAIDTNGDESALSAPASVTIN